MKNADRSKPRSREVKRRRPITRKPTAASIARRYHELQELRHQLTLAQSQGGA
jgi:hypothetical protein